MVKKVVLSFWSLDEDKNDNGTTVSLMFPLAGNIVIKSVSMA